LNESLYYQIVRTAMHMKTGLYRALYNSGLGITPEQWSVLSCLWESEGLSPHEIGRRTGRDKFTISRILKLLEKKGLILKKPDPRDKRRNSIHLTSSGRELQAPLTRVVEEYCSSVFQDLTTDEIAYLQRVHERIIANIDRLST
jgi:DNA-binding MarR family transcriptional regulator